MTDAVAHAVIGPAGGAPSERGRRQAEVADVIAAIWGQALNRPDIGPASDFWDMGGSSLTAIQIMLDIELTLQVELPVTSLYDSPSVGGLAAAIVGSRKPAFSPLVAAKAGSGPPPLFIVHGLGGHVMELFGLARSLDYAGPVFLVQSRGLDGEESPAETVDAMVEHYWPCIRAAQPEGPYRLAGFSFGGLIALELARRILSEGGAVDLLALLDSTPHVRHWPTDLWLRWAAWRIGLRLRGKAQSRVGRPDGQSVPESPAIPAVLAAVKAAHRTAYAAYRPRHYPGPLTLIASRDRAPHLCDPRRLWPRLADRVSMATVPGDHHGMIEGDGLAATSAALSRALLGAATASTVNER